ncbi:hypothetical protein P152DRAFT_404466 [Eremomyces bilateralis CBS 781.70]|uniref:FAD-binding FR-type domain-containing protein n=1 Tax=Eremomyces bilateralis CBS 781.70 TaxID=1392243 RepID=A0A6G1FTG8_9PEZI|nr:uncharacterized protein P152DRAFT_404466 [Eremomyces bilateralis CBS 781.70]KAF1808982.1 hypothetical protein P152DRAFT_404466 [Eremomyces bilateralis CBS 781.70]
MSPSLGLQARHIQDMMGVDESNLEKHWGYADRVVPCTNDPGSCEYLDAIYHAHDLSMLYSFIMWGVIGAIALIWVVLRILQPHRKKGSENSEANSGRLAQSGLYRAKRTIGAFGRKWLLPESFVSFFGHVSRLQLVILGVILTYLLIFSFAGLVYKTWVTPIKNSTEKNTRVTMGAFSDRIGVIAYGLTPLVVILSTRESVLSLLTGVPYQSFTFLHRWTGRVIFIQSFVHTLIWTVIEGKLYRPQPTVFQEWIKQPYMIFGCFAMLLITFLFIFSCSWAIRLTGYEFFRKTHYIVAALYIGMCWGHWAQLYCWMVPSLALMALDRAIRLIRVALIHRGGRDPLAKLSFKPAQASVRLFASAYDPTDAVVRLDFHQPQQPWSPGEHFYLTFPALSIWQAHPLTTSSLPVLGDGRGIKHTYIIRACKGETARLAALASPLVLSVDMDHGPSDIKIDATTETPTVMTPVLLCGPYGHAPLGPSLASPPSSDRPTNLLAVAGGTGISFCLPIVLDAVAHQKCAMVELVWMVRRKEDIAWVAPELRELAERAAAASGVSLRVRVIATREKTTSEVLKDEVTITAVENNIVEKEIERASSSSDSEVTKAAGALDHRHPLSQELVNGFLNRVATGRTMVVASGPVGLGRDMKDAVAARNNPVRVWKGDESGDVEFVWDERLTL